MPSSNDKPRIHLDAVRLARAGQTVLRIDDLRIDEARVGLVGRNGSGKSSLLRLLNGLLQPASGRIRVHGHDTGQGPEKMADTVGFLFQNPDHQIIFPTVSEELAFGLRRAGSSRRKAGEEVRAWLQAWHLTDWHDRPVQQLSEGQKQLVCLLAVLITRPRLLLLDEVFSALDGVMSRQLQAVLKNLPQQIVLISHDTTQLESFDRILWLENGGIMADGPPHRVLPAYRHWIAEQAAEFVLPDEQTLAGAGLT